MMVSKPGNRSAKRRHFQFTLRTLLLVVLLVACLLSWLGTRLRRATDQWALVSKLEEAGFQITYVSEFPQAENMESMEEWCDFLFNGPPGPSRVRETLGFEPFVDIGAAVADPARAQEITDGDLAIFADVPEVQMIGLAGTNITDRGLERIKNLPKLWCLDLDNTQITDAGLARLKGMTGLQQLYLCGTRITDAGLAHLHGMNDLFLLMLNDTRVTDAGIARLEGKSGAMAVYARNTQVTEAGARRLSEKSRGVHVCF
jgi:hypothetical protein